ncbi:hypothetical protein [Enterococcus mundtii]|uniref:hypothetical protein n=1 Tax=Enterococcus mundtii TaxID=53346 RepID=UPI000364BA17|nr:hypothetical protein [Enterococcus mundtii]
MDLSQYDRQWRVIRKSLYELFEIAERTDFSRKENSGKGKAEEQKKKKIAHGKIISL